MKRKGVGGVLPRSGGLDETGPSVGSGSNSGQEHLRFTLTETLKRGPCNLRSGDLGTKSTFGITASENNLSHLPGVVAHHAYEQC
jgi:hypothetical protein